MARYMSRKAYLKQRNLDIYEDYKGLLRGGLYVYEACNALEKKYKISASTIQHIIWTKQKASG